LFRPVIQFERFLRFFLSSLIYSIASSNCYKNVSAAKARLMAVAYNVIIKLRGSIPTTPLITKNFPEAK
jgi:hypothetical protein